jgi:hypothetical protein
LALGLDVVCGSPTCFAKWSSVWSIVGWRLVVFVKLLGRFNQARTAVFNSTAPDFVVALVDAQESINVMEEHARGGTAWSIRWSARGVDGWMDGWVEGRY